PADNAAVLAGKLQMPPGDALRLGAETDIAISRQRVRRVLQRLPEGGAVVPAPTGQGPDIKVGIEIDDADRPVAGDVAEIVAKGGLVPAAQHDGHCAMREERRDHLTEGLLRLLERAGDADIAEVERRQE